METKIKILMTTPFDKKGAELDIKEFRKKYGYICIESVEDEELIKYIRDYKSFPALSQTVDFCISDWFGVVKPKPKFKVGDWVWHEKLEKALLVVDYKGKEGLKPNETSYEAVNTLSSFYNRLATSDEVTKNVFLYVGSCILIGREDSYYFHNAWKKIYNVREIVENYIDSLSKQNKTVFVDDSGKYNLSYNGIRVGCQEISHNEMVEIAKFLGIPQKI